MLYLQLYQNMSKQRKILKGYYAENSLEAGIDEAGRGPLFGRVYSAAVILPQDGEYFDYSLMKDSKKFTNKKHLLSAYHYIKAHAPKI